MDYSPKSFLLWGMAGMAQDHPFIWWHSTYPHNLLNFPCTPTDRPCIRWHTTIMASRWVKYTQGLRPVVTVTRQSKPPSTTSTVISVSISRCGRVECWRVGAKIVRGDSASTASPNHLATMSILRQVTLGTSKSCLIPKPLVLQLSFHNLYNKSSYTACFTQSPCSPLLFSLSLPCLAASSRPLPHCLPRHPNPSLADVVPP